tara:strand:- start:22162 stop:22704 length:543 start_codon:yes stop_codon:yes gene_type:complete
MAIAYETRDLVSTGAIGSVGVNRVKGVINTVSDKSATIVNNGRKKSNYFKYASVEMDSLLDDALVSFDDDSDSDLWKLPRTGAEHNVKRRVSQTPISFVDGYILQVSEKSVQIEVLINGEKKALAFPPCMIKGTFQYGSKVRVTSSPELSALPIIDVLDLLPTIKTDSYDEFASIVADLG